MLRKCACQARYFFFSLSGAREDSSEIRRKLPRHEDACELIFAWAERKMFPNGFRRLHYLLHAGPLSVTMEEANVPD